MVYYKLLTTFLSVFMPYTSEASQFLQQITWHMYNHNKWLMCHNMYYGSQQVFNGDEHSLQQKVIYNYF